MTTGVLVVGASHAGVQVAISLRENGFDGQIALVDLEPHLPYCRPPLSKGTIDGPAALAKIALRNREFYAELGVDLILGEKIYDVDLDAGTAHTTSGRTLHFDSVALTNGAKVRRLPVPGADLPGVSYLRNADDALRLHAHLAKAGSVVVIGGGFIGLEAAALANQAGARVTLVEAGSQLMGRVVSPEIAGYFAAAHRNNGVDIRLDTQVAAVVDHNGHAGGVRLDDGTEIHADFVIVGIGVMPRTGLASSMGLSIAGGVIVDDRSRTSDPRVVAAGDCTVTENPIHPGTFRSLESVHNATTQAKAAADSLTETLRPEPPEAPWFWSYQGSLKLQMIMRAGCRPTRSVWRGDPASGKFLAVHLEGEQVVGADCVNTPGDFAFLKRTINSGKPARAGLGLDDMSRPLKELVSVR